MQGVQSGIRPSEAFAAAFHTPLVEPVAAPLSPQALPYMAMSPMSPLSHCSPPLHLPAPQPTSPPPPQLSMNAGDAVTAAATAAAPAATPASAGAAAPAETIGADEAGDALEASTAPLALGQSGQQGASTEAPVRMEEAKAPHEDTAGGEGEGIYGSGADADTNGGGAPKPCPAGIGGRRASSSSALDGMLAAAATTTVVHQRPARRTMSAVALCLAASTEPPRNLPLIRTPSPLGTVSLPATAVTGVAAEGSGCGSSGITPGTAPSSPHAATFDAANSAAAAAAVAAAAAAEAGAEAAAAAAAAAEAFRIGGNDDVGLFGLAAGDDDVLALLPPDSPANASALEGLFSVGGGGASTAGHQPSAEGPQHTASLPQALGGVSQSNSSGSNDHLTSNGMATAAPEAGMFHGYGAGLPPQGQQQLQLKQEDGSGALIMPRAASIESLCPSSGPAAVVASGPWGAHAATATGAPPAGHARPPLPPGGKRCHPGGDGADGGTESSMHEEPGGGGGGSGSGDQQMADCEAPTPGGGRAATPVLARVSSKRLCVRAAADPVEAPTTAAATAPSPGPGSPPLPSGSGALTPSAVATEPTLPAPATVPPPPPPAGTHSLAAPSPAAAAAAAKPLPGSALLQHLASLMEAKERSGEKTVVMPVAAVKSLLGIAQRQQQLVEATMRAEATAREAAGAALEASRAAAAAAAAGAAVPHHPAPCPGHYPPACHPFYPPPESGGPVPLHSCLSGHVLEPTAHGYTPEPHHAAHQLHAWDCATPAFAAATAAPNPAYSPAGDLPYASHPHPMYGPVEYGMEGHHAASAEMHRATSAPALPALLPPSHLSPGGGGGSSSWGPSTPARGGYSAAVAAAAAAGFTAPEPHHAAGGCGLTTMTEEERRRTQQVYLTTRRSYWLAKQRREQLKQQQQQQHGSPVQPQQQPPPLLPAPQHQGPVARRLAFGAAPGHAQLPDPLAVVWSKGGVSGGGGGGGSETAMAYDDREWLAGLRFGSSSAGGTNGACRAVASASAPAAMRSSAGGAALPQSAFLAAAAAAAAAADGASDGPQAPHAPAAGTAAPMQLCDAVAAAQAQAEAGRGAGGLRLERCPTPSEEMLAAFLAV